MQSKGSLFHPSARVLTRRDGTEEDGLGLSFLGRPFVRRAVLIPVIVASLPSLLGTGPVIAEQDLYEAAKGKRK